MALRSAKTIRKAIVDLIADSRVGIQKLEPGDLNIIADRIGVLPELIEEARYCVINKRGKDLLGDSSVDCATPPEVYRMLRIAAQKRNARVGSYVRALVHCYLIHDKEPQYVDTWAINGKVYVSTVTKIARARISDGAKEAFLYRVEQQRTTVSRLLRSILVSHLEGDLHPKFELVNKAALYNKKEDYFLPGA